MTATRVFDANVLKLAVDTPMADRLRAQDRASGTLLFSQGEACVHACEEMQGSKSLDRNSDDGAPVEPGPPACLAPAPATGARRSWRPALGAGGSAASISAARA